MRKVELIKFCGLTRLEDAEFAVANGADAIGFIAYRKSPRAVSPETVRAILAAVRSFEPVRKVGVFVNADLETVEAYLRAGLDTVQLHGDESAEFALECAGLESPATGKAPEIWKAFQPVSPEDVMRHIDFPADKFLIDSFKKGMRGGTGTVMDPEIAGTAVSLLPKPVILAGGLSPANIADAVAAVSPYGVDVNSGVESAPGVKDHDLMLSVVRALEVRS